MSYSVETVTFKGSEIFARLADHLQEHLTITGCYAVKDTVPLEDALDSGNILNESSWSNTAWLHTTHIGMSGVTTDTQNHTSSLMVYAQFMGDSTSSGSWTIGDKQVKTFYLHGHLNSSPNTEYVLGVASDTKSTRIPETDDIINIIEIRFTLIFTPLDADSTITVPSDSDYTLRSEFQQDINQISTQINNISGRVVTTHIEGEPTEGESQDIYGHKSFCDEVDFENDVSCQGSFFVTLENTYLARASITNLYDYINGYVTLESGMRPSDSNISLGSLGSLFKSIYSKDIYCRGLYPTESNTYSIGTQNIPWDSAYLRYIYNSELHTDYLCTYSESSITFDNDIVPKSGVNVNIGSSSLPWHELYSEVVYVGYGSGRGRIAFDGNVSGISINTSFIPSTSGSEYLGMASRKWSAVYAKDLVGNLIGCIPYPTSGNTNPPPIGSIFMAYFYASTTGPTVWVNMQVYASSLSTYGFDFMSFAKFDNNTWSSDSSVISSGKYVCLSAASTTTSRSLICLVMRIS